MNGVHDLGGTDGLGPVVVEENEPVWRAEWEKAGFGMFPFPFAAGWFNVDMFRYGIEQMHPAHYLLSPYYEHWVHTAEHYGDPGGSHRSGGAREAHRNTSSRTPNEPLPDTKNPDLVAFAEAAVKGGVSPRRDSDAPAQFKVGDRVRIRDDSPKGHTRRARYVRGKTGTVELHHGTFVYPDSVGNGGRRRPPARLHDPLRRQGPVGRRRRRGPNTVVYFDAWEPYLEPAGKHRWRRPMSQPTNSPSPQATLPRSEAEIAARVKALESIMIDKGLMTTEAVDRFAEIYENEVGPQLGAQVVAKAWTDPEFKKRLLEDGTKACAELGIGGLQGEDMVVVENTDTVHNVIVCTLCSCYPWPTLGLPPNWYKQPAYRVADGAGTAQRAP